MLGRLTNGRLGKNVQEILTSKLYVLLNSSLYFYQPTAGQSGATQGTANKGPGAAGAGTSGPTPKPGPSPSQPTPTAAKTGANTVSI